MIKESVIKAYEYAKNKHEGKKRSFSGLPYFTHPKSVARVIEDLTKDETMIIVALLHDILEDTPSSYEELVIDFGKEVADLINELTNNNNRIKEIGKHDYMIIKIRSLSSRALTVKLADRFHNILYLEGDNVPYNFVKRYYTETVDMINAILSPLNEVQIALINRIRAVLAFLKIRYNF